MKLDLKIFNFKNLQSEISGYGFNYSLKKYLLTVVLVVCATIGTGFFYQMNPLYMVICAIFSALCVPFIVKAQFVFLYKQHQYSEVVVYIRQMTASFARNGKIYLALQDTLKIAGGRLAKVVEAALAEMETSTYASLMEDSLKIIENVYPCEKIRKLHRYLLTVEETGGEYNSALAMLSSEFEHWIERTYKKQAELKRLKTDAIICVIICFFLGGASVMISGVMGSSSLGFSMDLSGSLMYQVASCIFVMATVMYYTVVQCRNTGDWLGKPRDDKKIRQLYDSVFGKNEDAAFIRISGFVIAGIISILGIVCLLIGGSLAGMLSKVVMAGGVILMVFALVTVLMPSLEKKANKDKLVNAVYEGFSEWLSDISISIQTMPLQSAIVESYETCPEAIKPSLEKFIEELAVDANDVRPYHNFLKEYNLLDISTAVMDLYAFNEGDLSDIDTSVSQIIQRNNKIIEKREDEKDKNELSVQGLSYYIPTIFITFKMIIDMLVTIELYLTIGV